MFGYAVNCGMADEDSGKYRKLTHTVYQCNYHIVWVPKYRYRVLEGPVKGSVEEDTRTLCQKEVRGHRTECAARSRAPRLSDSPKDFGVEVHGISEG